MGQPDRIRRGTTTSLQDNLKKIKNPTPMKRNSRTANPKKGWSNIGFVG
jgi:hypothetical protein